MSELNTPQELHQTAAEISFDLDLLQQDLIAEGLKDPEIDSEQLHRLAKSLRIFTDKLQYVANVNSKERPRVMRHFLLSKVTNEPIRGYAAVNSLDVYFNKLLILQQAKRFGGANYKEAAIAILEWVWRHEREHVLQNLNPKRRAQAHASRENGGTEIIFNNASAIAINTVLNSTLISIGKSNDTDTTICAATEVIGSAVFALVAYIETKAKLYQSSIREQEAQQASRTKNNLPEMFAIT